MIMSQEIQTDKMEQVLRNLNNEFEIIGGKVKMVE
jgi:hypothetical protein